YVQHRLHDPYNYFRFTAAERDPIPELWSRLQFIPGDEVEILLGGQKAITGIILVRQTAYDSNSHGVSLQGPEIVVAIMQHAALEARETARATARAEVQRMLRKVAAGWHERAAHLRIRLPSVGRLSDFRMLLRTPPPGTPRRWARLKARYRENWTK